MESIMTQKFVQNFADVEATNNSNLTENTPNWIFSSVDEYFRDSSRYWVENVAVPIVSSIGIVGNILTIRILSRNPVRSLSSRYLVALAYTDFAFLSLFLFLSLRFHPIIESLKLYWYLLPYGMWLKNAFRFNSIWLTVLFTVERYLTVCKPLLQKVGVGQAPVNRASVLCFGLLSICFLVSTPSIWQWKIVENLSIENSHLGNFWNVTSAFFIEYPYLAKLFDNDKVYSLRETSLPGKPIFGRIYSWLLMSVFVFLPAVVLSVFNGLLIRIVRKHGYKSSILRHQKEAEGKPQRRISTYQKERMVQQIKQEDRTNLCMILIVLIFLLGQIPNATLKLYVCEYTGEETDTSTNNYIIGFNHIFKLLTALHSASNFLLFTAVTDKYGKMFKNYLRWHSVRRFVRARCGNSSVSSLYFISPRIY